jgi:hypothetical protein
MGLVCVGRLGFRLTFCPLARLAQGLQQKAYLPEKRLHGSFGGGGIQPFMTLQHICQAVLQGLQDGVFGGATQALTPPSGFAPPCGRLGRR